jgi:hypothetical protein
MSECTRKQRKSHAKQNDNSPSRARGTSVDAKYPKCMIEPIRIRVLTLGSVQVGKSCFVKKYCEKNRYESSYIPTIGVDYGVKSVTRDMEDMSSLNIKIDFFDLSGELICINYFRRLFFIDPIMLLVLHQGIQIIET